MNTAVTGQSSNIFAIMWEYSKWTCELTSTLKG
jgi:hypothetical protein